MSEARSIGEILAPIIQRCADFDLLHLLLRSQNSPEERKNIIIQFRAWGSISDEETEMLIQAYMLETA
jgi:hypothetical protein